MGLKNQGAGMPDGGLFTESQYAKRADSEPLPGQVPERGVIEVKPVGTSMSKLTSGKQVSGYWSKYRLVLVTDLREFKLIGEQDGKPVVRERYELAPNEKAFWQLANNPRTAAKEQGARFVEFVQRVLLHAAPLLDPKDVAWFLASYARDAAARIESIALPALDAFRSQLEQALGLKFEGQKGEHFFRSTLVQTLFYGVFAAWVLWHRAGGKGRFEWHNAAWSLHVPMIKVLFEQLAVPSRLQPLGLEQPLDLAGAALNRINRSEFFKRFDDRHAVQYFYEPFLQAFDPDLRKQLGVWYTPEEIVKYMVRRIDQVLVSELGITDGLADPQVYVLDPCCGTGAFLVETLAVIGERLKAKGSDALAAQRLKNAMTERIFGFEVLPAPFVVSHLQIGLLVANLGAPLSPGERAAVYLTNALTGWEPPKGPKQQIVSPELEAERDAAEIVKRQKPILVILGNPPYNAFAGVAHGEESDLVEPYKRGLIKEWGIKKFNLDELYVRFFRLAERRIAEQADRGVVSFISNHSWISEPSFVVLRKQLLENFDRFWIENMHGNRKTSEYAPDGRTSETVFAVSGFSPGIQQGVAISLWVKGGKQDGKPQVFFRDDLHQARAEERRAALVASLGDDQFESHYVAAHPTPKNRFLMRPADVAVAYGDWPALTELSAIPPMNGLMEKRGGALIDVNREALRQRMCRYLDANVEWPDVQLEIPGLGQNAARFDAEKTRKKVIAAEKGFREDRLRRYAVRPFDTQYCYYSGVRPMWNEPRPTLWAQCWPGNTFLLSRLRPGKFPEGSPMYFTPLLSDDHLLSPDAACFPIRLRENQEADDSKQAAIVFESVKTRANLSSAARNYLLKLGVSDVDEDPEAAALIWKHALAMAYAPTYLADNLDGLRQDWPRIPLPQTQVLLRASAALGAKVAALLDADTPLDGVTSGNIRPELQSIAVISRVGGGALDPSEGHLAVTAGWGYAGRDGVTMPGKGRVETRAASNPPSIFGTTTHDIYLNSVAYWANVPEKVWDFAIGGYQVIKKWLSYRDRSLLGRDMTMDEVDEVTQTARRLAAIVLMLDDLDSNYEACKLGAVSLTTPVKTAVGDG